MCVCYLVLNGESTSVLWLVCHMTSFLGNHSASLDICLATNLSVQHFPAMRTTALTIYMYLFNTGYQRFIMVCLSYDYDFYVDMSCVSLCIITLLLNFHGFLYEHP